MLAAATLMLLHLAAFFQADDVIMREIPGSHPYLTGLGILGGMYSFANPLQGTAPNLFLPCSLTKLQHHNCCYQTSGCVQMNSIALATLYTTSGIPKYADLLSHMRCAVAGALFGPMLLSMLSVVYSLHAKLFRDEAPTSDRHYAFTHSAHMP